MYREVIMDKLVIKKKQKSKDTIIRTIRLSGSSFDMITDLAEENDVSFNYIVNQIIEYGLKVLEEQKKSNDK